MRTQKHPSGRRFVLSGPIGGGKSTVGRLLRTRGAVVIEADVLGHAVLEPTGEAFHAVAERWPDVVDGNRIDRAALAAFVFSAPEELAELERLTHPHIARRIWEAVEAAGDAIVFVELPLTVDLLGPGWHRVVVLAPPDVRLRRSVAKGMAEDDVRHRMEAQPPKAAWEAAADSIITNDGDLADLHAAVDRWWRRHAG